MGECRSQSQQYLGKKMTKNNGSNQSSKTKDLETLFVVAGCPGSGKSTIIRSAYENNIAIFGEKYHQEFMETCNSPGFQEYKDYKDAKTNQSIYQARHINKLEKDPNPPKSLLIHIDLKGVVKQLGHLAGSEEDKKRISEKLEIPTRKERMIEEEICDLMISSFLNNHLFDRFQRILVNTVTTNIENCSRQLIRRRFLGQRKRKQREAMKNLGFESIEDARRFHERVYKSWDNNLKKLNPEQVRYIMVNDEGSLMSNNRVIFANWTDKAVKRKRNKMS